MGTPDCRWLQSMTELPPPSTPSLWSPLSSTVSPLSLSRTLLRSLRPELLISLLWRPPRLAKGGDVRRSPPSSPAAPEFSPPPLPSSTTLQSSPPTPPAPWATTDSATLVSTEPTLATLVSTEQKYQNL